MTRLRDNAIVAAIICALFIVATLAGHWVLSGMDAQACRAGVVEACR